MPSTEDNIPSETCEQPPEAPCEAAPESEDAPALADTEEKNAPEDGGTPYFNNASAPEEKRSAAIWRYEEQNGHDKRLSKKEGRRNAGIFAAVMSLVFTGAILVLVLALIFGGALYRDEKVVYRDKVVYVREDGIVAGRLTVGEVYSKVAPSTVEVSVTRKESAGTGTGIIMTEDGYIITNAHVVENAISISVKLHDEQTFKAYLVGLDVLADLALIKVETAGYKLVPAEFGRSGELNVGDGVVAIGCPAGLFLIATNGIVSAPIKMTEIHADAGYVEKEMLVLQTSAELNPGNSGGPLANMEGQVVGINSMKLVFAADGTPYESLGYAIPIDEAMVIINRIKAGEQTRGEGIAVKTMRLGITGGFCMKGDSDGNGGTFAETGVYVTDIQAGTNADGKLKAGDIITAYNGRRIESFDPFSEHIKGMKDGDVLKLSVLRGNAKIDVEIKMDITK